jgi:anaerobic selenocysteine-containing dehydrogenase
MVTGARIKEYIHTQLRNVPEVRCLSPEPVAELHPAAAAKDGIVDGKEMIVETKEGSIKLMARLTPDIAEKVISVPHGWAKANVNELVNSGFRDAILGCPEDKGLLCRVRPA